MAPPRKYKKQQNEEIKTVSREDIENKLNEIDSVINETKSSATEKAKVALGVGVGVLLLSAFLLGKRKALRKKTFITFTKTR
ncbi:MAG: hypothetical protein U0R17_00425 [Acidimicrobiia bacterium]